jgi:hypothetical protein
MTDEEYEKLREPLTRAESAYEAKREAIGKRLMDALTKRVIEVGVQDGFLPPPTSAATDPQPQASSKPQPPERHA